MDVTISAGFTARPYDLRMRIYTIENNVGGNYSRYHGDRYAYSRSGYGSYSTNPMAVNSWIAGYYLGGAYGLPFAPGDFAGKTIGLGSYDTGGVGHDANGNLGFTSRIQMPSASVFGSADTGDVWMTGDHIIRPPAAPSNLTIRAGSITTTCFGVDYTRNGEAISQDQFQWATDAAFSNVVWTDNGSAGFTQPCTASPPVLLTPSTTYYVRGRSYNGAGWGAWSNTISQATLPAVAPGMLVTPTLSGNGASVALTPPGGGSAPTKYTVERRLLGSPAATSTDTTTSPLVVTGLTPGATYEWRASAWYGTYQSPWTAWTATIQPNPNTSPGQYFDGSTAATPDVTYAWLSTVNNSGSTATGLGVKGWEIAGYENGGEAVLQRVTGGIYGSYGARVIVKQDCGVGLRVGQANTVGYRSAVLGGASYSATTAVVLPRAQRMAAEITYVNSGGAVISRVVGASQVVAANFATTLSVTADVPAGATFALARVIDVAGTSHSPWLSGENFLTDGGMITLGGPFPYFDGSFPATPQFTYSWEGVPGNSISVRTTVDAPEDSLVDPDCVVVPPPPRPPIVPNTCIDEVGLWRRRWVEINSNDVREWFDTIPTLTVRTGAEDERQVRIRYYANPFNRPLSQISQDDFCSEIIVSYMPADTVLVLDGISENASAQVSGRASVEANHLLYGSNGLPASWPVLECGIGYYITLDVPTENSEGNVTVDFDLATRY